MSWRKMTTVMTEREMSEKDGLAGPSLSLSSTDLPVSVDKIPFPTSHSLFIERDYTLGKGVRFSTEFPAELSLFIGANALRSTITEINNIFMGVEEIGCRSCFETLGIIMSFNLISLCRKTYYEKCIEKTQKLIDGKNCSLFKRHGLRMVNPIYTGLRGIEIIFLDNEFRTSGIELMKDEQTV